MNPNLKLIYLVKSLSEDRGERRIISASLVILLRKRKIFMKLMVPFARFLPHVNNSKFILWHSLILCFSGKKNISYNPNFILDSLKATSSYDCAKSAKELYLHSGFGRGINYKQLFHKLKEILPNRLFIFHHYDKRGFLEKSWINLLSLIKDFGWTVIISTSYLDDNISKQLEQKGFLIANRLNIGLCLGAYKDLVLILSSNVQISSNLQSLILCNNSTLPILDESYFTDKLSILIDNYESSKQPTLVGLTDSSERGCYHLQSYFLYANTLCLKSKFWNKFWLSFNLFQEKEELINAGEIGLSQYVLSKGFTLKALYPLIENLIYNEDMSIKLSKLGFSNPGQLNQSLFAWENLLDKGCPLIKKRVIFDLDNVNDQIFPITSIEKYINNGRKDIIIEDIKENFISRNINL